MKRTKPTLLHLSRVYISIYDACTGEEKVQLTAYLTVNIYRGSGEEMLQYPDVASSSHHVETRRAPYILGEDNQIAIRRLALK